MNPRDSVTRSNSNNDGKISLDFSRHLCVTTRLARSFGNQRPSRRFSDSEATRLLRQTGQQPCADSNKRNETLGRHLSMEIQRPQRQVYNVDKTFHRKFGNMNKMFATDALSLPSYRPSRDEVPTNSVPRRMDDEARSFCDSISSIACSNFAKPDADRQKTWTIHKRKFPDKIAKFQAIEKWLQNLPEPVLKPGSERSKQECNVRWTFERRRASTTKTSLQYGPNVPPKVRSQEWNTRKTLYSSRTTSDEQKSWFKEFSALWTADEDARSFCDSVSSIACSSFAKENKEQNMARDYGMISDKIAKFNAIEKWLQNLPTPV
ncbi:hypothetical protein ACROYT_G020166 [Oculina patagonica]